LVPAMAQKAAGRRSSCRFGSREHTREPMKIKHPIAIDRTPERSRPRKGRATVPPLPEAADEVSGKHGTSCGRGEGLRRVRSSQPSPHANNLVNRKSKISSVPQRERKTLRRILFCPTRSR
jgi:hypothetical protein